MRASTWERLLSLQSGVLSGVLRGVMAADPVTPVLSDRHLDALDRRLKVILGHIEKCVGEVGPEVIVMDHR